MKRVVFECSLELFHQTKNANKILILINLLTKMSKYSLKNLAHKKMPTFLIPNENKAKSAETITINNRKYKFLLSRKKKRTDFKWSQ